jgi:hypothetical protein
MNMSDSKLDELTTHDVQTRCAQRAETNDLARERHAARRATTRANNTRDTCERHATTCAKQHRGTRGPTCETNK